VIILHRQSTHFIQKKSRTVNQYPRQASKYRQMLYTV